MNQNVFLKSSLRQPLRKLLLAALIFIATFAFVVRAVEYFIVSEELDRIEGLYISIGTLAPIFPMNIADDRDVRQAADLIGGSPFVRYEDRRVFVQGVLSDITNTTAIGEIARPFGGYFQPSYNELDINAIDHYIFATILSEPILNDIDRIIVRIRIDEMLVGDNQALRQFPLWFEGLSERSLEIMNRVVISMSLTAEEARLFEEGLHPMADIEVGRQYFFRVTPSRSFPTDGTIRPLIGNDGKTKYLFSTIGRNSDEFVWNVNIDLRDSDLTFFVDTSDTAALDSMLDHLRMDMELARENLHSLMVIGTVDMENMPRMQNPRSARLSFGWVVAPDGNSRWLTHDDYLSRNPVAVVPLHMATRKGLRVGETFTITLRNNPRPAWIDQETTSRFAQFGEGWWDTVPQGWWATSETREDWDSFDTYELELEVVGVYWNTPIGRSWNNFQNTEIYVPASLIPEGFGWDDSPLLTSMYSFILTSSRDERAFLDTYGPRLESMGFRASFLPNGFDNFAAAADPIRLSITFNLILFSIVSVSVFALTVFLYLRQWRKTLAIARALGITAIKSLRHLCEPALYVWVPAIVLGSVAAWNFAIRQSQDTLGEIGEFLADDGVANAASRSLAELLALIGVIALLVFTGLTILGVLMARRSVLEQLQGAVSKRKNAKSRAYDGDTLEGFAINELNIEQAISSQRPMRNKNLSRRNFELNYVFKAILRSPVKTALLAVVIMLFVFSLGWLEHTIDFTEREIERLWDTTIITAELALELNDERPFNAITNTFTHAPISHITMNRFLSSDFVQEVYFEALWPYSIISTQESFEYAENTTITFHDISFHTDIVIGVSNFYGFVTENTRTAMDDATDVQGENIEITFADGLGPLDFVFGDPQNAIPVIVRASFLEVDDYRLLDYLVSSGFDVPFQIIGFFENGLNRAVNIFGLNRNVFVVPFEALDYHTRDSFHFGEEGWSTRGLSYITARATMDTARNRELEDFREFMESALSSNSLGRLIGGMPLELLMPTHELSDIIEPMEHSLALLRIFYPIAISLTMIISVIMPLLIVLQSAKSVAIMRMLGKPKSATNLTLWVEQILVCAFGIIMGLVLLFLFSPTLSAVSLIFAILYLLGAVAGTAFGSVMITSKTPLELLQVRE